MYLGTSIGIAVRGEHLEVVCLRGRFRKVTVAGFVRIENFRTRPATDVAREYEQFRKAHHASTTSAVVALPRSAGLVRTLELPAAAASNLAQAVSYQIDSLHPFEEGEVYYDYAALGAQDGRVRVAVALVEKKSADDLYNALAAAGVDVAGFTLSTAGIHRALWRSGAMRPLVLIDQRDGGIEMLGLAPDGSFCSKDLPPAAPLAREAALCVAELRLRPEDTPVVVWTGTGVAAELDAFVPARLEEGLVAPLPEIRADAFRLREHFAAYTAALAALERRLPGVESRPALRWNLLPPEKRIYRSHWAHAAAYALAALIVMLAVAWAVTDAVQDRLYARWLDAEIRKLRPRVEYVEKLDARQKTTIEKLALLEGRRQDIARKLEAWQELTRLMPNSTWLQSLQFSDSQLTAAGVADSAAGLLQSLNQSPLFEQAEFTGAINKNNEGKEVFQIRMRIRRAGAAR